MTLPETLARAAAKEIQLAALRDGCLNGTKLVAAVESAIRESIEACAEIALSWPLSVANMTDAERYAKHGWQNAVAGVLRARVAVEIRALLTEETS